VPRARNPKGSRRGAAMARTTQPRACRGEKSARTGTQDRIVPPGLTRARAAASPPSVDLHAGLASGGSKHADLGPVTGQPSGPIRIGPRDGTKTSAPAASGPQAGVEPAGPADNLPSWAAKAVEELLTATCWLDPGQDGEPFSATIRFSGRRIGVTGKPQPGDTFTQEETVAGIVPGSGPVAITAEVRGIQPGQWTVTARPVTRPGGIPFRAYPPSSQGHGPRRVPWPRRVAISADPTTTVHTTSLLSARVPGVIRYAYSSLVFLGVLAGLGLEALLLAGGHYPVLRPILLSAAAVVAGIAGGKAWYIAVNRGRRFDGWCVQGFITGAAAVVAAVALAGPGVPAGVFLSAAAPALLIGMAIGRPGCFWAGCCAGRPTASQWGLWSSDRRLGCRREPTQLLEALASLVAGAAVLAIVLLDGLARSGPVALAGLAAYTLSRQFILGLRSEPAQRWRFGRQATIAVAAVALIASVVLLLQG
jgi:phosphatidylglycerol---prolipoprotein diacylglyceryl transferase